MGIGYPREAVDSKYILLVYSFQMYPHLTSPHPMIISDVLNCLRARGETRTLDLSLTKAAHYHCATQACCRIPSMVGFRLWDFFGHPRYVSNRTITQLLVPVSYLYFDRFESVDVVDVYRLWMLSKHHMSSVTYPGCHRQWRSAVLVLFNEPS